MREKIISKLLSAETLCSSMFQRINKKVKNEIDR